MRWWMVLLFACNGKGDDSGSEGDADTDTDADTDADIDAEKPFVLSGDVYCTEHTTGYVSVFWTANCVADDPQTAYTLEVSGHRVDVLREGATVNSYPVVCLSDGSGNCSGSFGEDGTVLCDEASQYEFQFVVVDEDGNESDPFSVTGRQN